MNTNPENPNSRCGYVAIIGRPNVGKSTLLNHLLGKKLSITSRKPQTTRHRILGVKTIGDTQILYVDTPGLHKKMPRQINRYMNRVARAALHDVDVILFVVDALSWTDDDIAIAKLLEKIEKPVVVAINKIDQQKSKEKLLPLIEKLSQEYQFKTIIPISALQNMQLDNLENTLIELLPKDVHYYPDDQFTDRSDAFVATEIIREKLTRFLGQEVPYALTVTIEAMEETEEIIKIAAIIWVERDGQKAIVIGKEGASLKKIGQSAREDMEIFFDKKVFVQIWVKVKSGWSDDKRSLSEFGYEDS